jgi:hypothetical protein
MRVCIVFLPSKVVYKVSKLSPALLPHCSKFGKMASLMHAVESLLSRVSLRSSACTIVLCCLFKLLFPFAES